MRSRSHAPPFSPGPASAPFHAATLTALEVNRFFAIEKGRVDFFHCFCFGLAGSPNGARHQGTLARYNRRGFFMSTVIAHKPTRTPETMGHSLDVPFEYPGLPTTCDGAEAVVHVEIHIAQAAGAYPITSSTTMGGGFNAAVMNGQTNLWGDPLLFFEPESEHSAASVCEGFAVAGGRVTNFTSGQGLVLMKEVLYTISGKRLPVVMNIGARALTSQGLNVHAGHDDVMSVADVGWGMLFARNAQEAGDFCLICRRTAEACFTPFFNVQDGFLTTHTVETVRLPELEFMKEYIGDPKTKLTNLMDPA